MTAAQTGMAVGAVLAIVGVAFGFWAFLFTAIAITIGAVVGRVVDGRLDIGSLVQVLSGRGSSS